MNRLLAAAATRSGPAAAAGSAVIRIGVANAARVARTASGVVKRRDLRGPGWTWAWRSVMVPPLEDAERVDGLVRRLVPGGRGSSRARQASYGSAPKYSTGV